MTHSVAAIDLGATSGRVMVGHVGPDELRLEAISRFANGGTMHPDGLRWDVSTLFEHAVAGLRDAAKRTPGIASVGVDSWAVDYALVSGNRILDEPFHYRDERTAAGVDWVHARVSPAELYARNGLQFLPFNTIYQLAVEQHLDERPAQPTMLLIPDLINFWLTGARFAERTNASTTGLLPVGGVEWDTELMHRVGIPTGILPTLINAGDEVGPLLPHLASDTGLSPATVVTAVGSHDTASAIVATPMVEPGGAYISCGTWGLVGVETERPVVSDAARAANFTNEGGVDGRTRFLHNVMGLWLLSESIRVWNEAGGLVTLDRLLEQAGAVEGRVPIFDTNDPRFMPPGDMPARIADWCAEHNVKAPQGPAETTRSIIESLANAFSSAVRTASELSEQTVDRIHMVGGGALNELLCQRTADRAGMPVIAGPIEATALGNVLIQARAIGAIGGSLESLRDLVSRTHSPRVFTPNGARR